PPPLHRARTTSRRVHGIAASERRAFGGMSCTRRIGSAARARSAPPAPHATPPTCETGRMGVIENSKVTVVGAGSVGSSAAYAALIRGSARHVALYDIATEKVEAEVLDLAHGTQFTGSSEIIGGSDLSVVEGSHVVVITAGAKQR